MRIISLVAAALALAACQYKPGQILPPFSQKSIRLSGDFTRADFQTYREIPFTVPWDVKTLSVELSYTGRSDRTVIDMGLRDPAGQRGWSGGDKSAFTIGEFEATPSYIPGKIQPGVWTLVLGVPNIREGVTAHYNATVIFDSMTPSSRRQVTRATDPVLSTRPGWRRGDFHTHTEHSDASCEIMPGQNGPCPLDRTIDAARLARLDFVAVTDHNTFSHREPLSRQQISFPTLLMIPGMEITTFHGHANAIGLSQPVEFQLGSPRLPNVSKLLDDVSAQGAILSINHPGLPSDESCMGCGWTAKDTPWSRVAAMEVVNGGTLRLGREEGPTSGIPVWENLLNQGYRITAIGGSDNHDATDRDGKNQSPVGKPATIVWASELSTKSIVEGVRSGRVFIDLTNTPGSVLDMEGRSRAGIAKMGGVLALDPGEEGRATITIEGMKVAKLKLVSHGLANANFSLPNVTMADVIVQLTPGSTSGWIRAEARDAAGKLLMLGNPIYVRAK